MTTLRLSPQQQDNLLLSPNERAKGLLLSLLSEEQKEIFQNKGWVVERIKRRTFVINASHDDLESFYWRPWYIKTFRRRGMSTYRVSPYERDRVVHYDKVVSMLLKIRANPRMAVHYPTSCEYSSRYSIDI